MDDLVEIGIKTTADTSGAQLTAAAIEKTSQATAKLTSETERYNQALEKMAQTQSEGSGNTVGKRRAEEDAKWLAAMRERRDALTAAIAAGAQANREDAQSSDDAAKKTEFLSLKKTELKKLVRELGHEFPIAGMAARAMMNPILAAFTGAIMVFGAAKKALDDWNAALDQAEQRNSSRDLLPGIEAKATAMRQGAAAAEEFQESLGAIGEKEDEFANKIKIAIDRLHEFATAQTEVSNAREANELANVNLQQKLGKLTEADAIQARAAIKEQYRQLNDEQKTQKENEELALKQQQLAHAKDVAPGLEYEAGTARRAADDLKARLASSTANLPDAKKQLESYEADFYAKLNAADAAKAEYARLSSGGPGPMGMNSMAAQVAAEAVKKAQAEADTAMRARDRQKGLVGQYESDTKTIPVTLLPGAESAASIAEAKAKANAGSIVSLGKDVEDLSEVLPIRQQGRSTAGAIKDHTTEVDAAKDMAQQLEQGQRKQEELQGKINGVIRSSGSVTQSMLNALQAVIDSNASLQEQLNQKVQTLQHQMGNMR